MAQEKNFENKIKAYLKSIGAYFIKTHLIIRERDYNEYKKKYTGE